MEAAKKQTASIYLKSDYDKAIKRMRKLLMIYDFNQRSVKNERGINS